LGWSPLDLFRRICLCFLLGISGRFSGWSFHASWFCWLAFLIGLYYFSNTASLYSLFQTFFDWICISVICSCSSLFTRNCSGLSSCSYLTRYSLVTFLIVILILFVRLCCYNAAS
jgi:hypothetical protein